MKNIIIFFMITIAEFACLIASAAPVKSSISARQIDQQAGQHLPYDSKVEWIATTSSDQYIDTQFVCTSSKQIISVVYMRMSGGYLCHGYGDISANGMNVWLYSGNGCRLSYGPTGYRMPYDLWGAGFGGIYNRVKVTYGNGKAQSTNIDKGVSYYADIELFDASKNTLSTWLFKCNGSSLSSDVGARLFMFQVQGEDGEILVDMVPVRFTNENGQREGAMFDIVSNQLFKNMGSGALAIGPDIR